MTAQHVRVKPVRIRSYSPEFGVDVSRVVGYRLERDDGEHGPTRKTVREARADLIALSATTRAEA